MYDLYRTRTPRTGQKEIYARSAQSPSTRHNVHPGDVRQLRCSDVGHVATDRAPSVLCFPDKNMTDLSAIFCRKR
jgi:hypothetical protein